MVVSCFHLGGASSSYLLDERFNKDINKLIFINLGVFPYLYRKIFFILLFIK